MAPALLLAENRSTPTTLWEGTLITSQLIEFEFWTRLHAYMLAESPGEAAHGIIGRMPLVQLVPPVVEPALDEFPSPVRTLDALHLAKFDFLWRQGQPIELASYDRRMADAARALGMPVLDLEAN